MLFLMRTGMRFEAMSLILSCALLYRHYDLSNHPARPFLALHLS